MIIFLFTFFLIINHRTFVNPFFYDRKDLAKQAFVAQCTNASLKIHLNVVYLYINCSIILIVAYCTQVWKKKLICIILP